MMTNKTIWRVMLVMLILVIGLGFNLLVEAKSQPMFERLLPWMLVTKPPQANFPVETDYNRSSIIANTLPDTQILSNKFYLPIIVYSICGGSVYCEDFFDADHEWFEGSSNDGNCDSGWNSAAQRYEIQVNNEFVCFRPAAETDVQDPNHRRGVFEVELGRESSTAPFTYGIYTNGKGGGEYYLFLVRFYQDRNCGEWELIRREDGVQTIVLNGSCRDVSSNNIDLAHTVPLKRNGSHQLRLEHQTRGHIRLYIDDIQVKWVDDDDNDDDDDSDDLIGTYRDSDPLNGKGTGVYARAHHMSGVKILVDDFIVRQ